MSKSFKWGDKKFLPTLDQHSEIKLKILREYLIDYITILATDPRRPNLKLTLVDGFAGGGRFENGMGSPFVMLEAVREAEFRTQQTRGRPLQVDCHYHFVESDRGAFACLEQAVNESPYKQLLGKNLFLHRKRFDQFAETEVEKIRKRYPRHGFRGLFLLDQCGYSEVNPQIVRWIYGQLGNKAEFIVNVAVKWMVDFLNNNNADALVNSFGLEGRVDPKSLLETKNRTGSGWAYAVESMLAPAWREACGIPFFSPFYIQPSNSHRGYWLLHLAPHHRARTAMVDVQWRHTNWIRHYGHAGHEMLAFKPEKLKEGYLDGLTFNDETRLYSVEQLTNDLISQIDLLKGGMTVGEFNRLICNDVMGSREMVKTTIGNLKSEGRIEVRGPADGGKRSASINENDIIVPVSQKTFFSLPGWTGNVRPKTDSVDRL